jgi:hypothetical protein
MPVARLVAVDEDGNGVKNFVGTSQCQLNGYRTRFVMFITPSQSATKMDKITVL